VQDRLNKPIELTKTRLVSNILARWICPKRLKHYTISPNETLALMMVFGILEEEDWECYLGRRGNKVTGAFSKLPREKIYDIWEIPPYGTLDKSDYSGLTPERIDCLLISEGLQTRTGLATNIRVRYQNYIKPYMHELLRMGALSIEILGYGRAVILKSSKN